MAAPPQPPGDRGGSPAPWTGRPLARWWRAGTRPCRRCTWLHRRRSTLGEQRRLLVDRQPADRQRRAERGGLAHRPRSPRTAGRAARVEAEHARTPRATSPRRCRSSSSVRDAVAASVTYPPARRGSATRRWSLTTPSVACGAPQPGHLRRGEVRVERQPRESGEAAGRGRPARASDARRRRSCQLSAGPSGRPLRDPRRSTVSPWLARPPPRPRPRPRRGRAARRDHRPSSSSGSCSTAHRAARG